MISVLKPGLKIHEMNFEVELVIVKHIISILLVL